MHLSMSGKGSGDNNAARESLFGRDKTTAARDHVLTNEAQVRANLFDYLEVFSNPHRQHASPGDRSPMQAEAKPSPRGGRRKSLGFLLKLTP